MMPVPCLAGAPPLRARTPLRRRARGFILAYVMYSLALLSVVTVAVSLMRSANDLSAESATQVESVDRAVDTLTLAVLMCATEAPVGAAVAGVATAYPLLPGAGAAPFAFGTGDAADLLCPGFDDPTLRPLWSGRDGLFLPQVPPGFGPWRYAIAPCPAAPQVATVQVSLAGAGAATATAVLTRVAQRSPAQRAFDPATGTLTVTLVNAPCPPP